MSTTTQPTATLNARGRIVLRGSVDADFARSLPGARWCDGAWVCDATPATAWRVCSQLESVSESIDTLAERFRGGLLEIESCQPRLRKGDAWEHQAAGYGFAKNKAGAMLAMGMGTGKSKVAVDLLVNRHARSILILCPVSVMGVWTREFEKHAPGWANVYLADKGSATRKVANMILDQEACRRLNRPFVCVVNYETARQPAFARWALSQQWDAVIADESHRAKGHNTATGKFLGSLYSKANFRLCLTGTPMPHSPLDLFSQFRFLDPGIFGTSFHRFRDRYARTNPMFASKVEEWLNQDELQERMKLLAFHVGAEVLDLPPVMHEFRRCELSDEAQRIYTNLEEDLIADIGSGVVTASNALVRLLRLQQITSGFAVDEDERDHIIDLAKERLLVDLLEDLPTREPVVVFCRFKFDLDRVRDAAKKTGRRYGEVSGREKCLTEHATIPEGIDLLGVQIQSGGVGVDFTRAAYAIYYSIGFSLGDYDQSLARLHRPGQTRTTHYYHLMATGTVDQIVYAALEHRRNVVEAVLEGLKHGN